MSPPPPTPVSVLESLHCSKPSSRADPLQDNSSPAPTVTSIYPREGSTRLRTLRFSYKWLQLTPCLLTLLGEHQMQSPISMALKLSRFSRNSCPALLLTHGAKIPFSPLQYLLEVILFKAEMRGQQSGPLPRPTASSEFPV